MRATPAMPARGLLLAAWAAAAACLLGLAAAEAEAEPAADAEFALDDACLGSSDSEEGKDACALNALQRHGMRKVNAMPAPSPPPVTSADLFACHRAPGHGAHGPRQAAVDPASFAAAKSPAAPGAAEPALVQSWPPGDASEVPLGAGPSSQADNLGFCVSRATTNCITTPNACCGGMACYQKNAGWASCMPVNTCKPGIHYQTEYFLYWTPWTCKNLTPPPPPPMPTGPTPAPAPGTCGVKGSCYWNTGNCYELNWKAEGETFFDDFVFTTKDLGNHGPADYVSKEEALEQNIIEASDKGAFMRIGQRDVKKGKRASLNIHSKYTWDPADSFVVAMRFQHVPAACGTWPAFWTVNTDLPWPQGSELDIFEWANHHMQGASLHTTPNETCLLDATEVQKCQLQTHNNPGKMGWNCATNYYKNNPGCAPEIAADRRGGMWVNKHPGVVAAEWTPSFVKIFYFPESQIPADLLSDMPRPATWDRFIISYFPWTQKTCPGAMRFMKPQEIVIDVALCGDFAGAVWQVGKCPAMTGKSAFYRNCKIDVFDPPNDCCNQWVMSEGSDESLNDAFYHIDWLKVYRKLGSPPPSRTSGSWNRGGAPLEE